METIDKCTIFLLAKAYQRGYAAVKKRMEPFGITPVQQLILAALWQKEGISAGDLGKRITLDSATLSGTLERLSDKGWIKKKTDANDKRMVRVFLTAKAKEQAEDIIAAREEANRELTSGLSTEEKILLNRLLKDLRG